jgi:hypothetical protein
MRFQTEDYFLASSFLGYAFFQISNYSLAVYYLSISARHNPKDYHSAVFLIRSLQALGRTEDAKVLGKSMVMLAG